MSEMSVLSTRLEVLHEDVSEIKSSMNLLSEAITKLALVEERQAVANNSLERAFALMDNLEKRIASLEAQAPKNQSTNIWVDRIIMFIIGGFVMALWEYIKKG